MNKLLFILPTMEVGGGTITSFTNLLPFLKELGFNIDVYAINNKGNASILIGRYAKILNPPIGGSGNNSIILMVKQVARNVLRAIKNTIIKVGIDLSPIIFKRLAESLDSGEYDYVIGFQEGNATQIASYFTKSKKIAWVHSIYSRMALMKGYRKRLNDYFLFDKIVCVSHTAADDMVNMSPELANKINVVYNAIDAERIIELSKEHSQNINNSVLELVSVGRIDSVKRFSEIPSIARKLLDEGCIFHWIIIGGVAEKEEHARLLENIRKYEVDNTVEWIGRQDNPYPYIKRSHILVCLSESETFNYTIAEAKVLGVPVVSADFPASYEFINNGVDGIVASIDSISEAIAELLINKNEYVKLKINMASSSNNNDLIPEQLSKLFTIDYKHIDDEKSIN